MMKREERTQNHSHTLTCALAVTFYLSSFFYIPSLVLTVHGTSFRTSDSTGPTAAGDDTGEGSVEGPLSLGK